MPSDEKNLDSALFRRIDRLNIRGKQELAKALSTIAADSRYVKSAPPLVVQPLFSSYSDSQSCNQ